jgi:hypothetical protein
MADATIDGDASRGPARLDPGARSGPLGTFLASRTPIAAPSRSPMPVLAFADRPFASDTAAPFREGDRLLDVSVRVHAAVRALAVAHAGALDAEALPALERLLAEELGDGELALLVRAIRAQGRMHVRMA